jgi:AcrR family transcriptional regulator
LTLTAPSGGLAVHLAGGPPDEGTKNMPRNTRDRLIAAAGDLFYQTGFQAVGLDQIIAAVGITKTSFYKHFASKDDLIIAILDRRDRADIAEAVAYMRERGGADPRGQILALFDLLEAWFQRPDFRGCFFMNAATEFASRNDPIHRAAAAHGDHLAAEILLRAQAAGLTEAASVTKQLMLLVSGAIAARHAGGLTDAAARQVRGRAIERPCGALAVHGVGAGQRFCPAGPLLAQGV